MVVLSHVVALHLHICMCVCVYIYIHIGIVIHIGSYIITKIKTHIIRDSGKKKKARYM